MEQVIRMLRELRASASATDEQRSELISACQRSEVPQITVYMSGICDDGWFEMQKAYVFTKRMDAHSFIWYYSPRFGVKVYDLDGKNGVPLEQWDPEADLFTDESLYYGATNINPVERMRQGMAI